MSELVTVHHPDKGTHDVPADQAQYLVNRQGWTLGKPKAKAEKAEKADSDSKSTPADNGGNGSTGDSIPEAAADRIAWIGTDPDRARQAATDEEERGDKARTTVTDHIAKVLAEANKSQED